MLKNAVRHFSHTTINKVNYGFIGLGQMGQYMAKHIYNKLQSNDRLYVYDVSSSATTAFLNEVKSTNAGHSTMITSLSSIKEFASQDHHLDYIITMVPEGRHVKSVITELVETTKTLGKFDQLTTFIDSSTIDITESIEIHELVKTELPNYDFIDAPVSGGVAGARNGTLSFMLSRPDHASIPPELNQLLTMMGKNIFPCGDKHGTGLAAKLSNNYLLAITNLAVADSFQLAKSFGLNLENYAKLVAVSTGKSWASVDNCPIPGVYLENKLPCDVDYNGGFVTKLTRKDLVLATQSAHKNGRFLFLGDIGKFWYDTACEDNNIANKDLAVLYKWLEDISEENGNTLLNSRK